jgi:hypothetical protein
MFRVSCVAGMVAALVLSVSQAMAEAPVVSYKVEGELKVGAKVTIKYRMTAVSVDVKAAKEGAKEDTRRFHDLGEFFVT